jgi:hypothetical protein
MSMSETFQRASCTLVLANLDDVARAHVAGVVGHPLRMDCVLRREYWRDAGQSDVWERHTKMRGAELQCNL